jgi:hypothetical protein
MANCWKETFARSAGSGQAHGAGGIDPHFLCLIPSARLAPALTRPTQIKGKHTALELDEWIDDVIKKHRGQYRDELGELLDQALDAVYE